MKARIFGLDSLRLAAIILIIIYHCFSGFLPGGFVAVEIFFTLSGFLMGLKLIRDFANKDRAKGIKGFLKFLFSRLGRLFPALLLCMIVTLSIAYFTDLDLLTSARQNSLYAATFSTNIMSIVNGSSYESALVPNIFNHTWFLALDLQVCLIAYVVFGIFLYFRNRKKDTKSLIRLGSICLIISIISFGIMALYGGRFELYDRAYFGPDSHIGAFFIGAALSAFVASKKDDLFAPAKTRRYMWYIFLILELALVISITPFISYTSTVTFIAALPIVAITSYFMIISILKLQSGHHIWIFRVFEYLGSISFYMYLFHWPFYIFSKSILQGSDILFLAPYIAILASLIMSIIADKIILPYFLYTRSVVKYFILAASLVLPVMSLIKAPEVSSIEESLRQEEVKELDMDTAKPSIDYTGITQLGVSLNNDIMPYFDAASDFAKVYVATARTGSYTYVPNSGRAKYRTPNLSAANLSALSRSRVMIIGDSVTLGAQDNLRNYGYFVDAYGSRNMFDAIDLLAGYRAANGGNLPYIIVISLITNYSSFNTGTLQAIMNTAGPGHKFVFVTSYCGPNPRDSQNATVKSIAGANVHIADWASVVVTNLGAYTYSDQIHLTPAGRSAYASLVSSVVGGI